MTRRLNRFSPSCNCCENSCTLFADVFDRSYIGSNWSIESGTWSIPIAEGSLQTTSAAAEIDQVTGGTASIASATVSSTASGDQPQVGLGSGRELMSPRELEIGTGRVSDHLLHRRHADSAPRSECLGRRRRELLRFALCSDTYPYAESTARLYTASFQGTAYHTWGDSVPGVCAAFHAVLATRLVGRDRQLQRVFVGGCILRKLGLSGVAGNVAGRQALLCSPLRYRSPLRVLAHRAVSAAKIAAMPNAMRSTERMSWTRQAAAK